MWFPKVLSRQSLTSMTAPMEATRERMEELLFFWDFALQTRLNIVCAFECLFIHLDLFYGWEKLFYTTSDLPARLSKTDPSAPQVSNSGDFAALNG